VVLDSGPILHYLYPGFHSIQFYQFIRNPNLRKEENRMKKLAVLFWIVLFCLDSIAQEPNSSWIASQDGKYFCTKISIHALKAKIVLQNGEKMSIPVDMINSFSLNGCEFDKLPLYKNGKITNREVFMELVDNTNGMNVYRYGRYRKNCITTEIAVHDYYLYDGKRLHLATNSIELSVASENDYMNQDYQELLSKFHH
jgi:hypothetical protein